MTMKSWTKQVGVAAASLAAVLLGISEARATKGKKSSGSSCFRGPRESAVPPFAYGPTSGGRFFSYAFGYRMVAPFNSALRTGQPLNSYLSAGLRSSSSVFGGTDPSAALALSSLPYEDPLGSYLRESAEVIDSQGDYLIRQQQARLVHEQVQGERIANRRRAFDEYLYERANTPTPEQERARRIQQERDRSRNDPPVTEIYSAKALNDLLADLIERQNRGTLPALALDEDTLRRVNITKEGGHVGLLKNEGRLAWPVVLCGSGYAEEKGRLSEATLTAVQQAEFHGRAEAGTLRQMQQDLDRLQRKLTAQASRVPAPQYLEARRFLRDLGDAVTALGKSGAGNLLASKWAAGGKTIPELVRQMVREGLQFAPAVAGDEAAYMALHRALATACATAALTQAEEQR
jgi:hypothetical protein